MEDVLMARGTAVSEPVVSQAQTKEWDEGYELAFGKDRKPQRGRWVWDEAAQKLVPADEYRPPEVSHVPIVGDSHYDGMRATDGTPIDTRRRHREYMKARGLTTTDDYDKPGGAWERAEKERAAAGQRDGKEVRETIARAAYEAKMGRLRAEQRETVDAPSGWSDVHLPEKP